VEGTFERYLLERVVLMVGFLAEVTIVVRDYVVRRPTWCCVQTESSHGQLVSSVLITVSTGETVAANFCY
jgi:hypothetical protein